MKRNLSKDEEQAAFRRKNAKDPNPNRKGKAINVKTEETQMRSVTEVADFTTLPLNIEIPDNIRDFNLGLMFRESLDTNSGMLFIFEDVAQQSFHMTETKIPLDLAFIKEDGIIESIKQLEPYDKNPVASDGEVICALEVNRGWFAENNVEAGDVLDVEYIIPNQREKYRSETNTIYDIYNISWNLIKILRRTRPLPFAMLLFGQI